MANLSQRGAFLAKTIMSFVPQTAIDASEFPLESLSAIDLAVAENWLVRHETLEILQQAVIQPEHLNLPRGFWGDPELLELLAVFVNKHFQPAHPILAAHICVTVGAGSSIDLLLNAICDSGDGILVPTPYWGVIDFLSAVRSGVSVVPVRVTDDILSCLGNSLIPALEASIASSSCKVRALILTNPNNPLGRCYSRSTLEECAKFCQLHGIHLVSDEVFAMSTFSILDDLGQGFTSLLALDLESLACDPSRCHVLWSLSKDLGLSGMRMGCTISQANGDLRNAMALTASMQVSTITNLHAIQLLRSGRLDQLLELNRYRLAANYRLLSSFFKARGVEFVPANATTSVLARLKPDATNAAEEVAFVAVLQKAGVLVSSGQSFHLPPTQTGWYRVGFAVETPLLQTAIERLGSALKLN